MIDDKGDYSLDDVKYLKRRLLGFCRNEAVKSEKKLYGIIRKIVSSDVEWACVSVEKTIEKLVELSGNGGMLYNCASDAPWYSDLADNIFKDKLFIKKRDDGKYKIFTMRTQEPAWHPDFS